MNLPDFERMQPLIFVLYDGIQNSVFSGQVVQPLLNQYKDSQRTIIFVSFEKKQLLECEWEKYIPADANIRVQILKKIPFIGKASLFFAVWQLKKILKQFPIYELKARGPLAGWICAQAMQTERSVGFTIQARGLLAQEYSYAHQNSSSLIGKLWHYLRMKQYESVERKVYQSYVRNHEMITIEAVSPALKKYLVQTFDVSEDCVTIAVHDIPVPISSEQKCAWNKTVRTKLAIAFDRHVYCYNGSAKPWQCPEDVVIFFKKIYQENANNFLLIITQDTICFEKLLKQHGLNKNVYHVIAVKHENIYRYLAAGDTGLLFRKPHIINWISRPTKVLEYKAAHLKIMHNNTVAYLIDS